MPPEQTPKRENKPLNDRRKEQKGFEGQESDRSDAPHCADPDGLLTALTE